MVRAVSTDGSIFAWISTVWGRSTQSRIPILWMLGLLLLLAVGAWLTIRDLWRVVPASADQVLHDTYYVVAHFHYVLTLGLVFAVFAAWYYLFPKVTGYTYSGTLGNLHFWLTFTGVGVSLLPELLVVDWPRRIADDPDSVAYLNRWSWLGSWITAAGMLVFTVCMLHAFVVRGRHG